MALAAPPPDEPPPTEPPAAPAATRRAAFFDIDGTVVDGSSLLLIAPSLYRARLIDGRAMLRAVAEHIRFHRSGSGTVEDHQRVAALALQAIAGADASRVAEVGRAAIARAVVPRIFPQAVARMEAHRRAGDLVFLVTSAPQEIADELARVLPVDGAVGTDVEIAGGRYTGRVRNLCAGPGKAVALRLLARRHGLDLRSCSAYGDSAADAHMLAAVGHPACVNPDHGLEREARRRGWVIVFHRLVHPRRERALA